MVQVKGTEHRKSQKRFGTYFRNKKRPMRPNMRSKTKSRMKQGKTGKKGLHQMFVMGATEW